MSHTNIRNYLITIFIGIFTLFILFFNKSLQPSSLASSSKNITSVPKIFIPREVLRSSVENQTIVFKDESPLVRLYLDVVRDTVCGLTLQTQDHSVETSIEAKKRPFNIELRIVGEDWPSIGVTMIGQKRLINIEWSIRYAIANGIPGDFIECGVWRGGGSIFARAVFKALDVTNRHVWVVDSFQGLPKARTTNDNDHWAQQDYLKVSLEEVQTNFRAFNLLDDQVHFCKGFFVDALPRCNVAQISVLRMDGDMYESTMDQLFNLYSKIPIGGIIIIDDYNVPECIKAINDFREWHTIKEEIKGIPGDRSGSYWIKKQRITLKMDKYRALLGTPKPA